MHEPPNDARIYVVLMHIEENAMSAVQRNQSQTDYSTELGRLAEALEMASGADKQIDATLAALFGVDPAEFTSSAEVSRRLSAQLLPRWQLRVGYDVCGIFPSATVSLGGRRHGAVAPTVPLAVLRALISAVIDEGGR
ncbi:MAG: hypothetical protein IE933_01595 [Sphingomonadales bacterium]|nr:hypothetical protein [Sphingomonadales bacterium]MBD3771949.1 hypothetical protein [Paracoccaceae bacterium]